MNFQLEMSNSIRNSLIFHSKTLIFGQVTSLKNEKFIFFSQEMNLILVELKVDKHFYIILYSSYKLTCSAYVDRTLVAFM